MLKKSKKILSLSLVFCLCMGLFTAMPVQAAESEAGSTQTPIYMDPSYSYAERAADLVGRMTTTQKGFPPTPRHQIQKGPVHLVV